MTIGREVDYITPKDIEEARAQLLLTRIGEGHAFLDRHVKDLGADNELVQIGALGPATLTWLDRP